MNVELFARQLETCRRCISSSAYAGCGECIKVRILSDVLKTATSEELLEASDTLQP